MARWVSNGRQLMNTGFTNSGRIAGDGILYDDYSESSGGRKFSDGLSKYNMRLPNDGRADELNGECIIVCEGKKHG